MWYNNIRENGKYWKRINTSLLSFYFFTFIGQNKSVQMVALKREYLGRLSAHRS